MQLLVKQQHIHWVQPIEAFLVLAVVVVSTMVCPTWQPNSAKHPLLSVVTLLLE